jgi:glycosyltransferase involved in cell wall biosynthesis
VVIPAFNEAGTMVHTLRELRAGIDGLVPSWEVRVVDDGSDDATASLVAREAEVEPRIALQCEAHRGKGAAVRSGLLASRGELRFICDADLSMPVHEITRFLAAVPAECDVAIGSREGTGAKRIGEPVHRHLMGRAFNGLVRAVLLPGVPDTQCGFKLFTARAVQSIFPATTIDGWAFDAEALYIARLQGWRVKTIPIEWHYRDHSRVSTFRDPWQMLADVYQVRRNALRGRYGKVGSRLSESPDARLTR